MTALSSKKELVKTLTLIVGIGPTKAESLVKAGVTSVEDLQKEIFRKELSAETLLALEYPTVSINWDQGNDIADYLIGNKCGVVAAGSIRRKRPMVGDVDILTLLPLEDIFATVQVLRSTAYKYMGCYVKGPQRLSIVIRWRGKFVQVDFFRVAADEWAESLLHYTGPYEFNIAMRRVAISKNMKLSQHGLLGVDGIKIECKTERDIFKHLGLVYKPPTLRDNGKDSIVGVKIKKVSS